MAAGSLGLQRIPLPRLAIAMLASMALHLSAVLGFHGPSAGTLAMSSAPAMTVRMMTGEASPVARQPVADERATAATPVVAAQSSTSTSPSPRAARLPAERAAAAVPAPTAPTDATGLPAAPAYRGLAGLDNAPAPLNDIEPEYPPSAGQQEGTVVLRLLINEKGHVDNVAVVRAFPKGFFEAASIDAFAKAEFSPGSFLGVPVKSQMMVEVHFTPINRGGTVSGHGY